MAGFSPSTECTTPGCHNLIQRRARSRKCLDCQASKIDNRPDAAARGYEPGWDAEYLSHYPLCAHAIPDVCTENATLADHFPVSRKDLVAQGVADPNDWQHLVPSCDPCHRYVTARLQPGGWNRPGWRR